MIRRLPAGLCARRADRLARVHELPGDRPQAGQRLGRGLVAEARTRQPLAGSLFAFETDVKGLPLPQVRG